MRHGISLAPFGEMADPWALSDAAIAAERSGFDGFFVWDHMLRAGEPRAMADPWVALAAVAARTERIRIGTLVTPLARRRPQKLARETVTLDHLSRGRLILGVGLGVNTGGELTRFGEEDDDRRRGDLLDEGLELLTRLWSGEDVVHAGPAYTADGVRFLPRPAQEPRIPVWVAAPSGRPRPVRRAARYDGICTDAAPAEAPALFERIRAERGSMDGFDVVAAGRRGADPRGWERAGATWWITALSEPTTWADVLRVIEAGPPADGDR
jgi:alkanesulfonate monooxygenase SsuD/methylene tetrahydromethanopterin reductase-like flavin-dependent oxidoreductase (luciferase family)